MLIKVASAANNNKFYHVTMDDAGKITTRWGRVGSDGTTQVAPGTGDRQFDSIVRKKISRGYQETSIVSTSGGERKNANQNLSEIARHYLSGGNQTDKRLIKLIDNLVAANAHDITVQSGGQMKVDDSGVIKTPLGIVDSEALDRADAILRQASRSSDSNASASLVDNYLSLVPQKVSRSRGWGTKFFTPETIAEQREFIKQLRDSLSWYESQSTQDYGSEDKEDVIKAYKNLFGFTITSVSPNSKVFRDVVARYEKSKNASHRSSAMRVKNVYTLGISNPEIEESITRRSEAVGNIKTFWHGTSTPNVLSILRRGLIVPPTSGGTIRTTGRMFGDGVYFSDQSSKSLNYSAGYWGGARSKNAFMFLADVAMGWEFQPNRMGYTSYTDFLRRGLAQAHNGKDPSNNRSFDSISVKGGTMNVLNNEMIVWDTDQVRLTHLIEFH